ncbi:uncharacterized protein HMPREF1541_06012 [Cyphellophora europaea CBS 101466]|uniref:Enoyl reductase (ER) domain-containing protein n=1 Tax=Cyphellophora europaea (strain CBS 101466) TaxID=1220924 RepID=W2RTE4_CYPE1|nr:uncharacterized protein HMPREF1541_06012 [Cyphellophora europaea CBS 101466]ETN39786.1 hypothetical protein HMPREF1541_06012 [Cyphellophora europaea CBS 101466]
MTRPTQTKQWHLISRPTGLPTYEGNNPTFTLKTVDLPSLGKGQVLLKPLFFSNDPAQRAWLDDNTLSYVPPVPLNGPMRARGIAEVVESASDKVKVGDRVTATLGWTEYVVLGEEEVAVLPDPPKGLSWSQYIGALGTTGLTAYYGLVEVGQVKKGQSVVVSGAAGATGNMAVQIAKGILGCSKVIGLAGSAEKCRWVESIGADKCINYKDQDWHAQLENACDGGVDVYFDNVGGEILDAMLRLVKQNGIIVACGGISGYNDQEPTVLKNYMQIVFMRLSVRGFITTDFMATAKQTQELFVRSVEEGKLKIGDEQEQVVDTKFEEVPKTWLMLFGGGNRGKLITKLM